MNTIPQNSTYPEDLDNIGLFLVQQRAVMLMVSGKSTTDNADELKIDRGTFYNWRGKYCF